MSNRHVFLIALLVCAATAAACTIGTTHYTEEFVIFWIINAAALSPVALLGWVVFVVKGGKTTLRATVLSGWIGGTALLLFSWKQVFPSIGVIGPMPPSLGFLTAFGGCLLSAALGLLIGSHIEPAPLPPHLCFKCGYDRRGLSNNARCPECGA